MDQATFLRQMRRALILRLPGRELHAIEADYKNFFADRIKEGKTEIEVCQTFGSPKTVARNILQETGQNVLPLGVLVFLGTALAGYLNWGWTWDRYRIVLTIPSKKSPASKAGGELRPFPLAFCFPLCYTVTVVVYIDNWI